MKFREKPQKATFLKRLNRFSVLVQLNDEQVAAHLPNSGRLGELLVEGRRCYVLPAINPLRKTHFDLVLIETPNCLFTSTDARLPNALFSESFQAGQLPEFGPYKKLEREVTFEQSRLDFRLSNQSEICYVEVKSVTLVTDGIALFPDAPTVRGTKHLNHLIELKKSGYEAAVVFWVQREDALEVQPYRMNDSIFAETLEACQESGVNVMAYKSKVSVDGFEFLGSVPVRIT